MRASIRGSIRSVMVTDSDASALPDVAASISRKSGRFSDQKPASASSLSKIGTSSQLANALMSSCSSSSSFSSSLAIFDYENEDDDEEDFIGTHSAARHPSLVTRHLSPALKVRSIFRW